MQIFSSPVQWFWDDCIAVGEIGKKTDTQLYITLARSTCFTGYLRIPSQVSNIFNNSFSCVFVVCFHLFGCFLFVFLLLRLN